jgi:hypothetical protein
MTMGPAPMIMIVWMSVRFGIGKLFCFCLDRLAIEAPLASAKGRQLTPVFRRALVAFAPGQPYRTGRDSVPRPRRDQGVRRANPSLGLEREHSPRTKKGRTFG